MSKIPLNSYDGIPPGWTIKTYEDDATIKNSRHVQLLRNNKIATSIDYFIGETGLWKNVEFVKQLLDGEQIIGKYQDVNGHIHLLYGVACIFYDENNIPRNDSFIEVFKKYE